MGRLLQKTAGCIAASLLTIAASSADIVVYDNFPSNAVIPQIGMTSEINTSLVDQTWTVDDAFMATPATGITRIDWVGERVIGANVAYPSAEFLIVPAEQDPNGVWNPAPLNSPNAILQSNLAYTANANIADPNPSDNLVPYTGSIVFPAAVIPASQRFYVGVRLSGNGRGRNYFVPTTIDGTVTGLSGGYTKADLFTGLSGPDAWKQSSDTFYGSPAGTQPAFEFAFRLYSVPEPGSLGLLLIGLAAVGLRKRI